MYILHMISLHTSNRYPLSVNHCTRHCGCISYILVFSRGTEPIWWRHICEEFIKPVYTEIVTSAASRLGGCKSNSCSHLEAECLGCSCLISQPWRVLGELLVLVNDSSLEVLVLISVKESAAAATTEEINSTKEKSQATKG